MGNSETKEVKSSKNIDPHFSWNVYLCRNRCIFDNPHAAWLEFHDIHRKGNIFCFGPGVRQQRTVDPSCTLRILSGRVSNMKPSQVKRLCGTLLNSARKETEAKEKSKSMGEDEGEGEVEEEISVLPNKVRENKNEKIGFACRVLQELNLPWKNEIYICRKRDSNFHVWVEFCSTISKNDKVHKFHLQFIGKRGKETKSTCQPSSSEQYISEPIVSQKNESGMEVMKVPSEILIPSPIVEETKEGFSLIKEEYKEDGKEEEEEEEEDSPDFVMVEKPFEREKKIGKFVDRHKILNPPGESNAYKVAVGFTNCSISEIVLVSNRVTEELNNNRAKFKPKPVQNCRTYILQLLDEIGLSSFQSRKALVGRLKSVWGSGKDVDWIRTFGGIGAATGIAGSSLIVGAAGIVICGVFIWNPPMESLGVGLVALSALGLLGTPVALGLGGIGGGIAGGGLSAFTLREIDRRFKKAKGKDVVFVEKTEDEAEREWIEVVLRDVPVEAGSEEMLVKREEIERKKREGINSLSNIVEQEKDEEGES